MSCRIKYEIQVERDGCTRPSAFELLNGPLRPGCSSYTVFGLERGAYLLKRDGEDDRWWKLTPQRGGKTERVRLVLSARYAINTEVLYRAERGAA